MAKSPSPSQDIMGVCTADQLTLTPAHAAPPRTSVPLPPSSVPLPPPQMRTVIAQSLENKFDEYFVLLILIFYVIKKNYIDS